MNEEKKKVWKILEGPKVWKAAVEPDPENPEECILTFPEALLERVRWGEGDTLDWDPQPDGTVIIRKI